MKNGKQIKEGSFRPLKSYGNIESKNYITQKALHSIRFCGNRLEACTVLHDDGINETEFQAAIQSVYTCIPNRMSAVKIAFVRQKKSKLLLAD